MGKMVNRAESFEEQRLFERFGELLREVRSKASASPTGTVIDSIERTILEEGRELLRQLAENEIQHAADEAEKKGRARARNVEPCAAIRVPRNGI